MSQWRAADGVEIYYETHGTVGAGAPCVLLPGLLGSVAGQWAAHVDALSATHPVVAMDLRGHGRSGDGAGGLTLGDLAGDVAGLLDHLGVGPAHVVGYSLGGYLGILLGLRRPERVRTLFMHGTKFYWTPEAVAATLRQLDPDAIAARVPAFAAQLAAEHGAERWPARVRAAAAFVARMDAAQLPEAEAAGLRCPVVVSVGDRDELVPVDEAARLRAALPDAGLLVLPRVRHAFGTVRHDELVAVLRGFHRAADAAP